MKKFYNSPKGEMKLVLFMLVVFSMSTEVYATTHVIQFGGSLGENYSPKSLAVLVGDTVEWVGDFSMHPLSSVSVPAGAASFHQGSGSTFSYPVTLAGSYQYQCDFHFSLGMVGGFAATTPTGIAQNQTSTVPVAFQLNQNFPNPFNPTTRISFDLPVQSIVSLKVYDLIGHEVASLINGSMTAGSHSVTWNAASMQSGVYFYKLTAGNYVGTKKLVLLK